MPMEVDFFWVIFCCQMFCLFQTIERKQNHASWLLGYFPHPFARNLQKLAWMDLGYEIFVSSLRKAHCFCLSFFFSKVNRPWQLHCCWQNHLLWTCKINQFRPFCEELQFRSWETAWELWWSNEWNQIPCSFSESTKEFSHLYFW